ncbi:MAG: hypothetical protein H0U04_14485 [Rubrobacter sp.]|nr:hypothetical protein [Rubrobacter sp.]
MAVESFTAEAVLEVQTQERHVSRVASNRRAAERNDAQQKLVERIRNASAQRCNDPDEVLQAAQEGR